MKNLLCLSLTLLFLGSCASKSLIQENQKEFALATQRQGEIYYSEGKYTASLQKLLEAEKILPTDPYLQNSLGLVYFAKERYDLAQAHFEKALDIKPDYIHAKNHLGAVYLIQEKWDLAIQCFEEVSENLLYPTPEIPLSNLGWAYFHQKRFRKSKTYFLKSLEIKPGFIFAIHGIASIYIETGYHYQAIDFLQHELKKNHDEAILHSNLTNADTAILHSDLAKAYEAVKDFNKAIRSWDVVLKLVPETSPLAREARKRRSELN